MVVRQGCILSPFLFNLHAEYIMRNTGLDFNLYAEYIMRNSGLEEAQAGIKVAGRSINNLRYADEPPLWQKVKRN